MKSKRNILITSLGITMLMIFVHACKSEDPEIDNPYDNQPTLTEDNQVDPSDSTINPETIQGLHKNIFGPTCANSGCHDGNFEPDFRTIESSYNTLVNQPVIKNDEMNPLVSRVTPGNASTSMLVRRLKVDLNGNSGIMPLVTEPGSDWHEKKDEYISNIEAWINNGALNQKGEISTADDYPIQLLGVAAKINGTVLTRPGFYEPFAVNAGTSSIEIWLAFEDDKLDNSALSGATINMSLEANNFDSLNRVNLQYVSTPLMATGFFNEEAAFHFKASIPLSTYISQDVIWLRFTINDGVNFSEVPNDQSLFRAKKYAAIRIK